AARTRGHRRQGVGQAGLPLAFLLIAVDGLGGSVPALQSNPSRRIAAAVDRRCNRGEPIPKIGNLGGIQATRARSPRLAAQCTLQFVASFGLLLLNRSEALADALQSPAEYVHVGCERIVQQLTSRGGKLGAQLRDFSDRARTKCRGAAR